MIKVNERLFLLSLEVNDVGTKLVSLSELTAGEKGPKVKSFLSTDLKDLAIYLEGVLEGMPVPITE